MRATLEREVVPIAEIVPDCPPAVQVAIQRACERDGLDPAAVQDRIDAQLSNEARKEQAAVVIDNSQTTEELTLQLKEAWEKIT